MMSNCDRWDFTKPAERLPMSLPQKKTRSIQALQSNQCISFHVVQNESPTCDSWPSYLSNYVTHTHKRKQTRTKHPMLLLAHCLCLIFHPRLSYMRPDSYHWILGLSENSLVTSKATHERLRATVKSLNMLYKHKSCPTERKQPCSKHSWMPCSYFERRKTHTASSEFVWQAKCALRLKHIIPANDV